MVSPGAMPSTGVACALLSLGSTSGKFVASTLVAGQSTAARHSRKQDSPMRKRAIFGVDTNITDSAEIDIHLYGQFPVSRQFTIPDTSPPLTALSLLKSPLR